MIAHPSSVRALFPTPNQNKQVQCLRIPDNVDAALGESNVQSCYAIIVVAVDARHSPQGQDAVSWATPRRFRRRRLVLEQADH
jgi:hypothetical protein